jgi:broad specificity phosphatase PhoE
LIESQFLMLPTRRTQDGKLMVSRGEWNGAFVTFLCSVGMASDFYLLRLYSNNRQWVLEECTSPEKRRGKPTGCIFVESICDDKELILENFNFKISNSPDYKGMSTEAALADLQMRVKKYEEQYETITDDSLSYIKIFNLSTKLLVNHIYGRMSKIIVPALMAWNIGTRPVFLCRPGQTLSDIKTDSDDYVSKVNLKGGDLLDMSQTTRKRLIRGDSLGPQGKKFSDDLYDFVFEEGMDFMLKRTSMMDMTQTGTSLSGLAANLYRYDERDIREAPFPLKIYTSTMPRAAETIRWEEYDFRVEELSNLNPLDKGDFAGKELQELQQTNPSWYAKLQRNPFATRFPGGESYKDLIKRLESVVVELEQQVIPTLVVSHVSTLQLLIAYFRNSPVEEAMTIEVPLHTVMKFTPARGGGFSESQIPLSPVYERANSQANLPFSAAGNFEIEGMEAVDTMPIWGDHLKRPSTVSFSSGTLDIDTVCSKF